MKTGYSYIRFSTGKQEHGDSFRRQTALTESFASKHKINLDSTLVDKGVSGFRGKNSDLGALAGFLASIKSGKVKSGSVLIIEKLDRLTRQEISKALTLFLEIINNGVTIATTDPEQFFDILSINANPMLLMLAIVQLATGNEESKKRSSRAKAVWQGRYETITERLLPGSHPAWLSTSNQTFQVIPSKAKIIKDIFTMRLHGYSYSKIAKNLNENGVPNLGTKPHWNNGYIRKILTDKTVIGTFSNGVITQKGYYPAVIDDNLFWSVQVAKRHDRGRTRWENCNLFKRLVFNGYDKSAMHLIDKGNATGLVLQSWNARRAIPNACHTFVRYKAFEHAFLTWITGLGHLETVQQPDDLLPLEGRLKEISANIAQITADIRAGKSYASLAGLLTNLETDRSAIQCQIDKINADNALADQKPVSECKRLIAHLDKPESRVQIRALISQVVSKIELYPIRKGLVTRTSVLVTLRNGQIKGFALAVGRGWSRSTDGNGDNMSLVLENRV